MPEIKQTGHGPLAVFSSKEKKHLKRAGELLALAIEIESENGNLHRRNYPDLLAAESALVALFQNREIF